MLTMHDFNCSKCGHVEKDYLATAAERDGIPCPKCGETMKRLPSAPAVLGELPQSGAIMSNGQHIKGHFGRSAPNRGRTRRD